MLARQVPRWSPHSKEEALAWSRHWPIACKTAETAAAQKHTGLPPAEVAAMQRHMRAAVELAAAGGGGGGGACNACIIVDPETGAVTSVCPCPWTDPSVGEAPSC